MKRFGLPTKVLILSSLFLSGCGGVAKQIAGNPELLEGEGAIVNGYEVKTYAFKQHGKITHLGVAFPYQLVQNPPTDTIEPTGAFAILDFPEEVKRTTFFNHVQIRWEPNGHGPDHFREPQFDIRAFSISEDEVLEIQGADSQAPDPARMPAGYNYTGVSNVIPYLGVRALRPEDLEGRFVKGQALAYWHNQLVAIEPMITRARLNRTDLEFGIPTPEVLGRAMRFPTHFRAVFEEERNAYGFLWEDFIDVTR